MPGKPTTKGRDSSFRDFVLEQLEGMPNVVAKRMFGGTGFYQDGVFFGIADGTRLFFKIDEGSKAQYEAAGMDAFRPTEKIALVSYYEVPLEVVEDAAELKRWAERAVVAQLAAQSAKKKAPRAETKSSSKKRKNA